MAELDLRSFDREHNDEKKIADDRWVPCRICEDFFFRVRLTMRYCEICKRAFCEGEHGSVTGHTTICVQCHRPLNASLEGVTDDATMLGLYVVALFPPAHALP